MNTPSYALDAGKKIEKAAKVDLIGITLALTPLVVAATTLPTAALTTTNIYTDAAVNNAINTLATAVKDALDLKSDNSDVQTLRTEVESRLDILEAKIDELLSLLK